MRGSSIRLCGAAAFLLSCAPLVCLAADDGGYRFETYAGVDYDGRAASLTSTMVWSPFGPISQPGFTIKADGLASVYGDTNASVFSSSFLAANLKGLGDVMAGFQFNLGPAWVKLYGGAAYEAQSRLYWEIGRLTQSQNWGGAAAVEVFSRIDDRIWSSSAASWLQPDRSGTLYSRLAYDFYKDGKLKIAAGIEGGFTIGDAGLYGAGVHLNRYDSYEREGCLLNIHYGVHDFSISGGMSEAANETAPRPYATLRYGRQF